MKDSVQGLTGRFCTCSIPWPLATMIASGHHGNWPATGGDQGGLSDLTSDDNSSVGNLSGKCGTVA